MTEEKVDDYQDIYNFAGLTPDWARYWFAMDGWSVDEAAHLLLAVAPNATLLQSWVNHTRVGSPFDIGVAMRYEAAHRLRRDMLLRAGEAGHLTFPAAPRKVIEWAMAKSLSLPELLIPLGAVFRNGAWVTSQGLTHVEPRAAPVVAVSASGGDDGWKAKAQKMASEIIKRDGQRDLYPSQTNIADEIAREFRTVGVRGADGKPLTGSYIKRHALKGISSAQGRQLSTAKGQGK